MISVGLIREKIKEYLVNKFSFSPSQIEIELMDKPADLPGQWVMDTRPMFWVRDRNGKILYVIKTAYIKGTDPWKFSKLERSLAIFNSLGLSRCQTISCKSFHRLLIGEDGIDIAVMTPARGRNLLTILAETTCKEAQSALIEGWAKALGELHLARLQALSSFPAKEQEKDLYAIKRFAGLIDRSPEMFPFGLEKYLKSMKRLKENAESGSIIAGITHGDPDPSNIFFDASLNNCILVDIDRLGDSADENGMPTSRIGNEFVQAKLMLIKSAFFRNYPSREAEGIGNHFRGQYRSFVGENFPSPSQLEYYTALYISNKITWISGLEEGLHVTKKPIPASFKRANEYRESLIETLEGIVQQN